MARALTNHQMLLNYNFKITAFLYTKILDKVHEGIKCEKLVKKGIKLKFW